MRAAAGAGVGLGVRVRLGGCFVVGVVTSVVGAARRGIGRMGVGVWWLARGEGKVFGVFGR